MKIEVEMNNRIWERLAKGETIMVNLTYEKEHGVLSLVETVRK